MATSRWPTAARPLPVVGLRAFLLAGLLVTTLAQPSLAQRKRGKLSKSPAAAAAPATEPRNTRPPLLTPAFHQGRREALRQRLPAHSVAVLFAGPVRNMAADVDYSFHQDPDFYYLTGLREPGAALLLFADPQPNPASGGASITELLFVRPNDRQAELWNGPRLGPAGAARDLKLSAVLSTATFATACPDLSKFERVLFIPPLDEGRNTPDDSTELADLLRHFRQRARVPADFNPARERMYARIRRPRRNPEQFHAWLTQEVLRTPELRQDAALLAYVRATDNASRAAAIQALPAPGRLDVITLDEALNDLREIKQPEELVLLRYAIQVTLSGHREALRSLTAASSEGDLDGIHLHAYRHFGATAIGYAPIVGAGANGCVLHYEVNDKERVGTDMVVADVGAAYGGYTADVTRTAPGSGKFTPEQRAIYDLVLQAQEAGIAECKAGNNFFAPGEAATRIISKGLLKLGLIAHADSVQRYFPHGTSHYLGLDVHDRGNYGPLRANSVITVEPGIYIPPGSPCDRKWWGIGCRIEDDILITAGTPENLSAGVPRDPAALEQLIAEPSAFEGWLK